MVKQLICHDPQSTQRILLIRYNEITVHKLLIIHKYIQPSTSTHRVWMLSCSVSLTDCCLLTGAVLLSFYWFDLMFPRDVRPFIKGTLYSQKKSRKSSNSTLHTRKGGSPQKALKKSDSGSKNIQILRNSFEMCFLDQNNQQFLKNFNFVIRNIFSDKVSFSNHEYLILEEKVTVI